MILLIALFSMLTYNAFATPIIQKIDDSTAGELVSVPIKAYKDELRRINDRINDENTNLQSLTVQRDDIQAKLDASALAGIADAQKVDVQVNAIGP